ncbi:hypothetical protein [Ralstonia phage BHDT_So9]|uniref:Uncharacterized protein n=1 Tax=Ralstonia phage BHDT_So9 TaxID=2972464 RepID=A0A9E7QZ27_9CAUD|nr:hypothetical protein [Ralstonia phage BHDT_So9]UWI83516.1 hypothetical protein [Ralstonia phage DLDT_So2]UZT26904.1 hypothetical protein [Ralstonia phage BHDTSo81]WEM03432.1 hypothetical protein [Ralstonia phage BHDT8]
MITRLGLHSGGSGGPFVVSGSLETQSIVSPESLKRGK